jgi:hypothetical protein
MKRVIIESPYAGDVERNVRYARAAVNDCLHRGEAPIASHLLFTQEGILDDNDPDERALGIAAGLEWAEVAEMAVFYVDHGWSPGMLAARDHYVETGIPIEVRTIARDSRHSPNGEDPQGLRAEPEWRGDGREADGNRPKAVS